MSEEVSLFDNGNFAYLAEIKPTTWDAQIGFTLTIRSQWRGAKNPDDEQVRFFACLDRDGLERLSGLIDAQLRKYQGEFTPEKRKTIQMLLDIDRGIRDAFRGGADLSGYDTP